MFSSFIVCSNRNKSALVCALLRINSLRARDLIMYTTDLQRVN